jgi:hypothetical protein
VAGGYKTKCDKCGKIIEGGRKRLIQHKQEFHLDLETAGDSTKIEEAANYGQVRGNPAA